MASRPPTRPKGSPKTGGRKKGTPNKVTVEVKDVCRRLVEDPEYLASLQTRLKAGTMQSGLESMIWAYAYGKPKESLELSGSVDLQPRKVVIELHP